MTETGELAVMCDTFHPLRLSSFARGLDDGKYALSWYEPAEGEPSTAGATSHLRLATAAVPHSIPGNGRAFAQSRLVLDWDGTVTEVDSLHLVLLEFGDEGVYDEAEARLGPRPHLARGDRLRVRDRHRAARRGGGVGARARTRPRGVPRARRARYRPTILSSGFRELIEPVLEREGVELDVLANELDPRPDGWRAVFRDDAVCAECGEPCKRAALPERTSSSSATASPTTAQRSSPAASSPATASPRTSSARACPFERFGDLRDVAAALR